MCVCIVFLKSVFTPIFIFFLAQAHVFCCYCIMNVLRGLLMLSKCHNVTDPVTRSDYLVLLLNALYSIYALWDVVRLFICVPALSEQRSVV